MKSDKDRKKPLQDEHYDMGGFGSDSAYRNKQNKYDSKKNYSDDDQDNDERDNEY